MARRYEGQAPCPGCGISGTEKPRYGKDNLCRECKDLLKLGKEYQGLLQTETGSYSSIVIGPYTPKTMVMIQQGEGYSDTKQVGRTENPYYLSDTIGSEERKTNSKELNEALREFVRTIHTGKDSEKTDFNVRMDDSGHRAERAIVPTKVAKAFFNLYDHFAKFTREVYNEGKDSGSNLLMKMHKGEITEKHFREAVEKKY